MEENENPHSNLVGGKYAIKEKLGNGSFGEVRLAIDTSQNDSNNNEVAIKFEHKSDLKKHLQTEFNVYNDVQGTGFPVIYWFGKHGDYTALVCKLFFF